MNPTLAREAAKAVGRYEAPAMSLAELEARLAEEGATPLVVDTRAPAEIAVSRLPGAIPWQYADDPPPEELIAAAGERPMVFYCSIGERSGAAADQFRAQVPDAEVYNLEGGIFGWGETGRPLEGGDKVHPYNAWWGRLIPRGLRAKH